MSADLAITLTGLRLPSPVLPASGTFGLAHGRVFDLSRLGAIVPKTVTPEVRAGRPAPRLTEEAGGLMNAIGIPSVGLEAFIADVLPHYVGLGPPLVVSLSAETADAFAAATARLSDTPADALELNLSCPNLEAGGDLFAMSPASTERVIAACRSATRLPLWVKLTPAAGAPADVARAAAAAGADALILSNTMPALALDAHQAPRLANRTGGLSGAPLKPITLRLVDEVSRATALPIIACGGVAHLADALDYFAVGASAVAVGTATLARPSTLRRLIDDLGDHCTARGVRAADIVAGGLLAAPPQDTQ